MALLAKCLKFALIVVPTILIFYLVTPILSLAFLKSGIIFSAPLDLLQYPAYYAHRHVFQYENDCSVSHEILIYVPKNGECNQTSFEFDVELNFDDNGRVQPASKLIKQTSNKIAALGDSMTMGWGVADGDTWPNILQQHTSRKVINLGVSSYAAERSIRRLILSPEFGSVSTIVLQYSLDDLQENLLFPIDLKEAAESFNENKLSYQKGPPFGWWYLASLNVFNELVFDYIFRGLGDFAISSSGRIEFLDPVTNSEEHLAALIKVIEGFSEELGKRNIYIYNNASYGRPYLNFGDNFTHPYMNIIVQNVHFNRGTHFYLLDDHPTFAGQMFFANKVIEKLAAQNEL